LTNAVYFQGNWSLPFDPNKTQDWPFQPTPDTSMNVRMMRQVLSTLYYENNLMQAAALPFMGKSKGGGSLALVVILPKSADNFSHVAQAVADEFDDWLSAMAPQRLDLKLPKFTINSRFNLNGPLEELGMEDPFNADANFVGIDGLRDLILSNVIHQAYFNLNETGVTAAAATAAAINTTAMPDKTPSTPMSVDHPFLFFIVDLKSQEMLFMGQVMNPD
jgi:serpin B